MKNRLSTWRTDMVTIGAGDLYDLTFFDTKPNMFYVSNPNKATIFCGIERIPTMENYEHKIESYESDAFGRPLPCQRIFILNLSDIDIKVNVYSIADEFDMGLLKQIKIDSEKLSVLAYDGIIKGFKPEASLPAGNNKIGIVKMIQEDRTALDALHNDMNVLLRNGTSAGQMNLYNLYNKMGALENKMTEIKNAIPNAVPDYSNFEILSENATTNNSVVVDSTVSKFVFFQNDGDIELTLGLNTATKGRSIVLKPGEIINDLTIKLTSFSVRNNSSDTIGHFRTLFFV